MGVRSGAVFRLSAFTVDGRHLDDYRLPDAPLMADVAGDSAFTCHDPGLGSPELVVHRLTDGGRSVVLPDGDSVLRHLGGRSTWYTRTSVAARDGAIVVADTQEYQLFRVGHGRLTWAGSPGVEPRTRSPAKISRASERLRASAERGQRTRAYVERRIEALADEVLPHFSRNGVHFDGRGRLWVIGQTGDSAFLDAFRDGHRLGRITVSCTLDKYGASVNGEWVGLLCRQPAEESFRGVDLRLYRLVEAEE